MCEDLKEKIVEILFAIYKIPGQFAIAGLIALYIAQTSTDFLAIFIFYFLCAFLFILEAIAPFLAGVEIYKEAIDCLKKNS